MVIETYTDEHELTPVLVYDEHDRWLVFGEETSSPVTVLAVMLIGTMSWELGEA